MVSYSGRRWAIQWPAPPKYPCAVPQVYHFATDTERDAWVAQNRQRREAVGVRNPHVKAWRQVNERSLKETK